MLENLSTPKYSLLLCPLCYREVPKIKILIIERQLHITIHCFDTNKEKTYPLKVYLKYVDSQESPPYFSSFRSLPFDGYTYFCLDCFSWACSRKTKCRKSNLIKKGIKYFEFHIECLKHNDFFTSYCINCDKNQCPECKCPEDTKHNFVTLEQDSVVKLNELQSSLKNIQDKIKYQVDRCVTLIDFEIAKEEESVPEQERLSKLKARKEEIGVEYQLHLSNYKLLLELLDIITLTAGYYFSKSNPLTLNFFFNHRLNSFDSNHFDKDDFDSSYSNLMTTLKQYTCVSYSSLSMEREYVYFLRENAISSVQTVLCLIALKDGRVATGTECGLILIWDMKTVQLESKVRAHFDIVKCLCQLSNGNLLSGSTDGTIKCWDIKLLACLRQLTCRNAFITKLIQLTDGRIVSGFCRSKKKLMIWEPSTYSCITRVEGHSSTVLDMLEVQNGVMVSSSKNKIKVISTKSFGSLWTIKNHKDKVTSLVKINSKRFASGSYDNTIRVWDLSLESCIMTLKKENSQIDSLLYFEPNVLFAGLKNSHITAWNLTYGIITQEIRHEHSASVMAIAKTKDGEIVSISPSDKDSMIKWNLLSVSQ